MPKSRKDDYPDPNGESWEIAEPSAAYGSDGAGSREERYLRAAGLLREWMAEGESSEDELWPMVKEELASRGTCL